MLKIGIGYDVHKLVPERKLILGGVEIPFDKGLLGHSDADVLVHAVIDSIIGALGLGDIGTHFPDSDGKYKDISSIELLKNVAALLKNEGFEIVNIDSVIIAQKPKLASFIEQMKKNIAGTIGIEQKYINIKATTEEGLGFTGAELGISAQSVCLIQSL